MSIFIPELVKNCKRCSRELKPGALTCDNCHALVHAEQLATIAAEAKQLEEKGELLRAREHWLMSLQLLPKASKQANWIEEKARNLNLAASAIETPETESEWGRKLAPLGAVGIVLAKSKAVLLAVFKLKFLLSFASFIGPYWALYGWKFGIGFAVSILIHEMGHFIDVKRRGLPAEMLVFLPGFGAYVQWDALGVSLETRAAVALAGPFAGLLAALVCAALWWKSGDGMWSALARAGAWLNVLNLIPVWTLDGGHAALAMSKTQRILLLTLCVLLWVGLGESMFFLVAAGAGWRLFTKDLPPHPSARITAYYCALMTALGLVMFFFHGEVFGK